MCVREFELRDDRVRIHDIFWRKMKAMVRGGEAVDRVPISWEPRPRGTRGRQAVGFSALKRSLSWRGRSTTRHCTAVHFSVRLKGSANAAGRKGEKWLALPTWERR